MGAIVQWRVGKIKDSIFPLGGSKRKPRIPEALFPLLFQNIREFFTWEYARNSSLTGY